MAAETQQYDMYESESGDAIANNNMTPSHHQNHSRNLAWWKSNPQRRGPSASSSVYSTSSEKGLSSSTTSIPSHNHEQGQQQIQHKQESTCNSERWSQYSSASASSFLSKKKTRTRNPLKWLHRRTEPRSSVQYQQLEQDGSDTTPRTSVSKNTSLSDEIIRDLKADIVQKMGILEGKIDALSSSQGVTPQDRRRATDKDDAGIQTNLENCNQQGSDKNESISYHSKLEERITHLTNTSTNLSSLNALLSSDLYSLQNSVQELQEEVCLLREEKFSLERRHGSYDEQRVQIDLQVDIIRRLGVVLGRKEKQLERERRMMNLYRDRINGFEDKVEMLRTEWERVLPLVMPKDKGPILTTVKIDKNK
ncbi:hypothetical protein PISL3812_03593 [Talaromyces islandicus]|uniref:Uncharacterized protein n=1 Tax=Talaromyces islandicus TaxID=28573 RepID=A0A0U1LT44_TALIS|nr:hypothetical protein PISL3812_03593 [Talaromyces islandicus]